ncbi:hypothetical protein O181_009458 [Austropuccinia psidii MF-1]|uniref:Integrase catalytic domain-containing protein n=1 Tax=Austropuccinia psidii MF-1 TaxID=1389203 RepID=A0A9Q3BR44_9BASI|nr:hypothetical protein [Austropuccinia psidii MF-1]
MEAEGDVIARQPIVKLNCQNWIWCHQQLKYAFVYKGYNNLFDTKWTKSNKSSPELIKANAFGMSTLLSTVSDKLQPVPLQKEYFPESLEALAKACGQNSIITLCQKLFDLVNLTYDPNTSLANHAYKFVNLYQAFQNCAAGNTFQMDIGEVAIAAILLMSIGQDSSLIGLEKTLYYATPFNLEQITNRLLVEDSQRSKKPIDSTLYLNQSKQLYWPPHLNHFNPEQSKTGTRLGLNLEEKFKVFLDKYMKQYISNLHSANQAKENSGEDRSTKDTLEDNEGFYVQMDQTNSLQVMSISEPNTELIHDYSASQSTVCNLALLSKPQPTHVTMRNFSCTIKITLMATDWHIMLGHPSTQYLKKFLQLNKINQQPLFSTIKHFHVCKSCKLKAMPHNLPIPSAKLPFEKLHFDTLEIMPLAKHSTRYVLVIIDDFSHFNRVYLLSQKSQAKSKLLSFINEMKNKIHRWPAYLQTDWGGEFNSTQFHTAIEAMGVVFKQGPVNSPQTNGIAEQFDQALLMECRCLIAQSNVPINSWDEAVKYSSLLINNLPSCSLNWKSPVSTLLDHRSLYLGPWAQKYFRHPNHYSTWVQKTIQTQAASLILKAIGLYSPKPKSQQQPHSPSLTPPTQESPSLPTNTTEPEEPPTPQKVSVAPTSPSCIPIPQKKVNSYVPHYTMAPKNISSTVSQDNILASSWRGKIHTEGNPSTLTVDEDLFLNEDIPFKTELQDANEAPRWKEAMDREFNSLTSKNTGTLVPSPGTDKTIGGMWCLVRKRNEFGKVLKYKALWAAFLYGEMDEPKYVAQVSSYEVPGKEDWVWKLNKSLYGTKQAPQQWKAHLVKALNTLGLTSTDTDECLFTNHDKTLFLHIHVDNCFIVGKLESMIEELLKQINQTSTIKTKKNPTQHLGYTLSWQLDGSIILHQDPQ